MVDDDMTDSSILDDLRKERHRDWKAENLDVLRTCGIPYSIVNNGETVLFRERGKPKVDFYPSTGRWRNVGPKARTFGGGAMQFLEWYAKAKID
jgi:hypothetical protein